MKTESLKKTRYIVRIGVLGALAFIVMLFEFPLGFGEFLKLDLSDIIALIGGVTMGPFAAIAVEFVKNLLKVVIITRTAGIGELANFVIGVAFVFPVALIYSKINNKKGLVIGLFTGIITMSLVASLANYFVFLPLYWKFVFPNIEMTSATLLTFIKTTIIPFNVLKGIIISGIGFAVCVSMKPIYRHIGLNN